MIEHPDTSMIAARAGAPAALSAPGTLRYLAVAGLALLVLVLALEPDVGFAAPFPARLLFWAAQIGTGLLILQMVLHGLTRVWGASRVPSWALVVLSGVLGAVPLSPVFWLIGEGVMEHWLGYPALPDDDVAGFIPSHALVAEYIDIVGPVTAAWMLICLPRLHWLVPPLLHGHARQEDAAVLARDDADCAAACPAIPAHATDPTQPDPAVEPAPPASPRPRWCERLPTELGTDLIAVTSELQYLRVWTTRGCGLILGALADVEVEGADQGLRVHRSWWVSVRHVVSVRRTAQGAVCLMSDGREVPVSRRRRADVLARFGDGVRYVDARSSEAVTNADLD